MQNPGPGRVPQWYKLEFDSVWSGAKKVIPRPAAGGLLRVTGRCPATNQRPGRGRGGSGPRAGHKAHCRNHARTRTARGVGITFFAPDSNVRLSTRARLFYSITGLGPFALWRLAGRQGWLRLFSLEASHRSHVVRLPGGSRCRVALACSHCVHLHIAL